MFDTLGASTPKMRGNKHGYEFGEMSLDGEGRHSSREQGGTHGHHPWTVDGLTVRPAGQVTDRGLCSWIDAPKAQFQSRLMVDQHRSLFDARSVGGTHGHHPRTIVGLTVRPAGPWFVTENFPRTQSENLAKSRLTDRPTVRRSDHGSWSLFVDRDFPYQPLTQTTVDQHRP
ncbi:hypothetical protein MTR67_038962 [Solanum verrucosum]|uniref:Uncharacterized protein n=1 Tax=Solanum verrucosum TaxID=315347 RepID=A0AAF0UGD8_SOLVR|nr:hypothetical protein MTR67_038962 [Solanum verrucosum]